MNITRRASATAIGAACALSLQAVPATAVGDGYPVVVAPVSEVQSGYVGPYTIDFSNAPEDGYEIEWICDNSFYEYDWLYYDGYNGHRFTFETYDPIKGPANCEIRVRGEYEGHDTVAYFTVAPPPLPPMGFDSASVAPATFYPIVQDGYRDVTALSYALNQRADVTVTVTNSGGTRIRNVALGSRTGMQTWNWDGTRDDGNLAGVGSYTITVSAVNGEGQEATVSRRVTVATSNVTQRGRKQKWGHQGRGVTRGDCYISRDRYEGMATLDCWGGRFAQMTYGFRIPSGATNLRYVINGALAGADIRGEGKVIRRGFRTSATRAVVRQRVTGWRAYDIWSVTLKYTYTKRV